MIPSFALFPIDTAHIWHVLFLALCIQYMQILRSHACIARYSKMAAGDLVSNRSHLYNRNKETAAKKKNQNNTAVFEWQLHDLTN